MLGQGNTEQFQNAFAGSTSSFSAIALGFYSEWWSYDGWSVLSLATKSWPYYSIVGSSKFLGDFENSKRENWANVIIF